MYEYIFKNKWFILIINTLIPYNSTTKGNGSSIKLSGSSAGVSGTFLGAPSVGGVVGGAYYKKENFNLF